LTGLNKSNIQLSGIDKIQRRMTRKVRDSVGFNQIIPFFILYHESCIMYLVSKCQASPLQKHWQDRPPYCVADGGFRLSASLFSWKSYVWNSYEIL